MKDLKTQLEGIAVPAGPPSEPTKEIVVPLARRHPILGELAHQGADWWRKAKAVNLPKAPKRSPDAKLHAAIQQTDALFKAMKNAGRGREAEEIRDARKRWLADRDQLAWGILKEQLQATEVSDKLYRSLKQGDVDPVAVLERFERIDPSTLVGMGSKRLRELLTA